MPQCTAGNALTSQVRCTGRGRKSDGEAEQDIEMEIKKYKQNLQLYSFIKSEGEREREVGTYNATKRKSKNHVEEPKEAQKKSRNTFRQLNSPKLPLFQYSNCCQI